MAPEKLTEYERKRLENIRRNEEMIAALHLHAAASQLSATAAAAKRYRAASSKSHKSSPEKKPKTQSPPVVIRRSLRTRGVPPDYKGLDDDFVDSPVKTPKPVSPEKPPPRVLGPLSTKDAYSGSGSDRSLINTLKALYFGKKPRLGVPIKDEIGGVSKVVSEEKSDGVSSNLVKGVVKSERLDYAIKIEKREFESCVDLGSMSLEPENIARIVAGRILVVKFLPCHHLRMVAVGNKFGNVAFWNMDHKDEEEDENGKFLYRPHTGPVSAIVFQPSYLSKIFTSCYNGLVRLMDAEKEVFDLVYSTDDAVFTLSQKSDDPMSLFVGEGRGGLNIWDERMGKCSSHWTLHEDRINSIDFNSQNSNLMATSSTDGIVSLWDLRNIKSHKPKSLKILNHKRAVHSAYFSPSGSSLATTSADDTVGILSGVDFDNASMVYHFNQTGRWISSFRAIWGWDDAYVFIGNMKRGVDVISPAERKTIMTLQSPHMSAIPCRFHAHPSKVGMLAGATSGGQVYVWTSS